MDCGQLWQRDRHPRLFQLVTNTAAARRISAALMKLHAICSALHKPFPKEAVINSLSLRDLAAVLRDIKDATADSIPVRPPVLVLASLAFLCNWHASYGNACTLRDPLMNILKTHSELIYFHLFQCFISKAVTKDMVHCRPPPPCACCRYVQMATHVCPHRMFQLRDTNSKGRPLCCATSTELSPAPWP